MLHNKTHSRAAHNEPAMRMMVELNRRKRLAAIVWRLANGMVFGALSALCPIGAEAQDIFEPPKQKRVLQAVAITGKITLDGKLDEPEWQQAPIGTGFMQSEPNQGKPARNNTKVRILYDNKNLYVGAEMNDSLGLKGLRVPTLRRDIDFGISDLFGIIFDGFLDNRNAMSFQSTPWGNLRDLMAGDGGNFFDRDWDAYWSARTTRTDSGWTVEMRIPFNNLRYPRIKTQQLHATPTEPKPALAPVSASATSGGTNGSKGHTPAADTLPHNPAPSDTQAVWGVNFFRLHRRINEESAWAAYPRAYGAYRMQYAGLLKGIKPPPPGINLRLVPYFITEENLSATDGQLTTYQLKPRVGGEVKWAMSPKDVLDLTLNTDFAQADVDRQVVNLSRFSVFFPERRQFFLENSQLFRSGWNGFIEPFFSRSIGLDGNGNVIPIDAGARFTSRHKQYNIGLMAVRQRAAAGNPATNFLVGRYQYNFGEQNRVGLLVSGKLPEPDSNGQSRPNGTYTADGLFRFSQKTSLQWVASATATQGKPKAGYASVLVLSKNTNQYNWALFHSMVSPDYDPQTGFVATKNFHNPFANFSLNYRPSWRPSFVRAFEPQTNGEFYVGITDGQFQQGTWWISPINIRFQSDAYLGMGVNPQWQVLQDIFTPVGLTIAPGKYQYTNFQVYYNTDPSKKFFFRANGQTGGYYNGQLNSISTTLRYSPIPHVSVTIDYRVNALSNIGEDKQSRTTHLLAPEVRLAYNPRLQFIAFYQYNSVNNLGRLNARLSWEFLPLSFLFLVYNNFSFDQFDDGLQRNQRILNQQTVFKLTYLKQF